MNLSGSIAERAQDFKNYLENNRDVSGKKVHTIAHSMGGLDSRFMISKLGTADRVLSLTTIGTPHHGSPIADIFEKGVDPVLNQLAEHLGIDIKGAADLTTNASRQFNNEVLDSPGIRYFSIGGQFRPPILGPGSLLRLTHDIIKRTEKSNDGLVSVASATFAERPEIWTSLDVWEANHFRVINWRTDILLTHSEREDNSIVEKYRTLAARVN